MIFGCTVRMHMWKSICVTESVVTGPLCDLSPPFCSHSPANRASGDRAKGTHQVHPTSQALWKWCQARRGVHGNKDKRLAPQYTQYCTRGSVAIEASGLALQGSRVMVWTALNSVMRKWCCHLCRLSGLGAFWGLGHGLFVAMSSVSLRKCTLGRLVCWSACMMHFRLWKYKYVHTYVYPLQLEVLCSIVYYVLRSAGIGACRSPMNTSHPLSADMEHFKAIPS